MARRRRKSTSGDDLLDRHVAVVHLKPGPKTDRDPDPDLLADYAEAGRVTKSLRERMAMAAEREFDKVDAAMASFAAPLHPLYQAAFWKMVEHAHGKPTTRIEASEEIMLRIDMLDD